MKQPPFSDARFNVGNPADPGQPSSRQVVQAYGRLAPLYDLVFGRVLEPGRRLMAKQVSAAAPASILEVGVGTGLALAGYPASSKIVGIDLSAEMLQRAGQRAAGMPGRHIEFFQMDAEAMDFPDHSFDCVTLPYVLSVTPHPARLVHEVRRVCKPGGLIFVLNHFNGSRFWWLMERAVRRATQHVGFRSDFDYAEQVLAYDWEVASVQAVNLLGLSKLVTLRNQPPHRP